MSEIGKRLDNIEEKINIMKLDMNSLKIKFNDELHDEIQKRQTISRWKMAISTVVLSGVISFIVVLLTK